MQYITKKLISCERKEINALYHLLWKFNRVPSYNAFKNIKRCVLIWFCIENNTIIGIWAIKQASKSFIQELSQKTWYTFPENVLEYGYIYVSPFYRWLWITKKIKKYLFSRISWPMYATTNTKNIPMKKLLKEFSFDLQWHFKSIIKDQIMELYTK